MFRFLLLLTTLCVVGWYTLGLVETERERRDHTAVRATRPVFQEPTAEERSLKAELESQLLRGSVRDRIRMTNGRVFAGHIINESRDAVRMLRAFGDSGTMEMTLQRSEIASIDKEHAIPPSISFRDVRFKLEFPDFNLYRRPPFTIMTTEHFFDVEHAMETLAELHSDVLRQFDAVIGKRERSDGIQILFFSNEEKFVEYRDRFAPSAGFASGFYSPMKDRLVIFDQQDSEWADDINRKLDREKERHQKSADRSPHFKLALHRWRSDAQAKLLGIADGANLSILRHEGAHQLFSNYGVHSEEGSEHLWLIEGLATYSETRPHQKNANRVSTIQDAKETGLAPIGFSKLVNFDDRSGLGGIGGEEKVLLAYAQCWLLVYHVMEERPEALFEYIRFVRDPANAAELRRTTRFALLSRFTGRTPNELSQDLRNAYQQI